MTQHGDPDCAPLRRPRQPAIRGARFQIRPRGALTEINSGRVRPCGASVENMIADLHCPHESRPIRLHARRMKRDGAVRYIGQRNAARHNTGRQPYGVGPIAWRSRLVKRAVAHERELTCVACPLMHDTTNRVGIPRPVRSTHHDFRNSFLPRHSFAARFVVRTVSAGLPLEYEERPFEWVEGERFSVLRVLHGGVMKSMETSFALESDFCRSQRLM